MPKVPNQSNKYTFSQLSHWTFELIPFAVSPASQSHVTSLDYKKCMIQKQKIFPLF